jgi:hypothetical protein
MKQNHSINHSINWHPAFVQALKQELEQYKDALEFLSEYQLNAEPLEEGNDRQRHRNPASPGVVWVFWGGKERQCNGDICGGLCYTVDQLERMSPGGSPTPAS